MADLLGYTEQNYSGGSAIWDGDVGAILLADYFGNGEHGTVSGPISLTGSAGGVVYVLGAVAGTFPIAGASTISLLRPGPAFTARYAGTVGPRRPAAAAYARHKQTQPSRNLPGLNARRTNVSRGAR